MEDAKGAIHLLGRPNSLRPLDAVVAVPTGAAMRSAVVPLILAAGVGIRTASPPHYVRRAFAVLGG